MQQVIEFHRYSSHPKESGWNPLGSEDLVRKRLEQQSFTPIDGGYQIRRVYLGDDLVVYVPKRREPIFWEDPTIERILDNPFLAPIYRKLRNLNSVGVFHLKQMIKLLIAAAMKDPAVGPRALIRTLESYGRAERLGDLVDPFLILESVRIRTARHRHKRICWAIVRERCDESLLQVIQVLVRVGRQERARVLIEEMVRLDERIWSRGLLNRDCSLKNVRIRSDRVVLRDAGQLTSDYAEAQSFVRTIAWPDVVKGRLYCPVRKNLQRLSRLDSDLAHFYLTLGREVYDLDNLAQVWPH